MDYSELCSQILEIDPKIRIVAIYDEWAKKLAMKKKEGVTAYVPEKMTQESVNQAILRWKSRQNMVQWIGRSKYAMSEYEKIKRFTFYLDDDKLLLVTSEPMRERSRPLLRSIAMIATRIHSHFR